MPYGVHPTCHRCGRRVNTWTVAECLVCQLDAARPTENDDNRGYDGTVT